MRRKLSVVYAIETYLTDPPTVESLRFTVQEPQRSRHQQQSCDLGCAECVPYQSLKGNQVPGAPVAPQYEFPPPLSYRSAQKPAASTHKSFVFRHPVTSTQRARCLESACSGRKLVVQSPGERRKNDPNGKPHQVAAAAIPAPAAPVKLCTMDVLADCSTSSTQSETFSPSAKVKEKTDAARTAPSAFKSNCVETMIGVH